MQHTDALYFTIPVKPTADINIEHITFSYIFGKKGKNTNTNMLLMAEFKWLHCTFGKDPTGVSQWAQLLHFRPTEMGRGFWKKKKKRCDWRQFIHQPKLWSLGLSIPLHRPFGQKPKEEVRVWLGKQMVTYPGCTTDGSCPTAGKQKYICNWKTQEDKNMACFLDYYRRNCRLLVMISPQQDAWTACTVENFSSSWTLCISSKPSS